MRPLILALLLAGTAAYGLSPACAQVDPAEKRVNLNVKNVPLREAIDLIFMGSGLQYAVEVGVPNVLVTLTLRDISIQQALRLTVRVAASQVPGLAVRREGDFYVVRIRQPPAPPDEPGPPPPDPPETEVIWEKVPIQFQDAVLVAMWLGGTIIPGPDDMLNGPFPQPMRGPSHVPMGRTAAPRGSRSGSPARGAGPAIPTPQGPLLAPEPPPVPAGGFRGAPSRSPGGYDGNAFPVMPRSGFGGPRGTPVGQDGILLPVGPRVGFGGGGSGGGDPIPPCPGLGAVQDRGFQPVQFGGALGPPVASPGDAGGAGGGFGYGGSLPVPEGIESIAAFRPDNTLLVRGTAKGIDALKHMLRLLDIPQRQIRIRVSAGRLAVEGQTKNGTTLQVSDSAGKERLFLRALPRANGDGTLDLSLAGTLTMAGYSYPFQTRVRIASGRAIEVIALGEGTRQVKVRVRATLLREAEAVGGEPLPH